MLGIRGGRWGDRVGVFPSPSVFISPEKDTNSPLPRAAAVACGAPSCRPSAPWATQRPRRDGKRAPWTPRGRRAGRPSAQQARITATGCGTAPALVQLVHLLHALGGGPSPHALAKHCSPASPRRARPTRRIPLRSQAVRPTLTRHAAERQGTLPGSGKARWARAHAETARVRPGTEPHPCVSPRRRVADLQACAHPTPTLTLTLTDTFRAVITGHGPGAHGGVGGVLVSILRLLGRSSYGSARWSSC